MVGSSLLLRRAAPLVGPIRACSTSSYINVNVSETKVAKVSMDRRPANVVDTDFFRRLKQAFDKIEKSNVAGVILTSSVPRIFSAGLDIKMMAQLKPEDVKQFAAAYYDCWQTLYEFPLPTAAAITGHAPALGCLLAVVCEHRVMVDGCGKIGLNEVAFGMPPDQLLVTNFKSILTIRAAEEALLTGHLFTTAEALKVGLIDEVALSSDDALSKCENFIKRLPEILTHARGRTKKEFRRGVMKSLGCPDRKEFIDLMIGSADLIHQVFQEYSKRFKSGSK